MTFHVGLRGRPAPPGHRPPTRARAVPAHAREHRRAALRRRDVGQEGQGGARRLRRGPAGQGGAGPLLRPAAGRDPRDARRAGLRPRPALHAGDPRPVAGRTRCAGSSRTSTATTLAEYLVGGVLKADLHPLRAHSLKWDMLRADDFVLTPLPNHLFQRDNSCWIYGGVTDQPDGQAGPPARDAAHPGHLPLPPAVRRRRLRHLLRRRRPQLPAGHHRGRRRPRHRPRGGADRHGRADDPDGRRDASPTPCSTPGRPTRVVAVELPHSHAFMHLDTVMSMVDTATFVLYPYFDRHLRSWTVTAGEQPGQLTVVAQPQPVGHPGRDPRGRPRSPCSTTDEDIRAAEREQWDDGTNYLAVAPGVVFGYERNVATNTMLRKHGIEVVDRRRQRARPGPRWPALHDLPHRARPGLAAATATEMTVMNLHGRSFLKEVDFTKDEFLYLVDLADAAARRRSAPAPSASGWPGATSPSSSRRPPPGPGRPSRSARTTRGRTSPTSGPRSPSSATRSDEGHRPGARADVRRHRVPGLRPGDRRDARRSTPACRCGTG